MKFKSLIFVVFLLCFSCTDIVTHHLNVGLDELEHSRVVNEKFVEEYGIEKIGFFKLEEGKYKFALKLNNNITEKTVESYTLGMHIKVEGLEKKHLPKGKNYISFDSTVQLEEFNGNKYVIRVIETPVKKISSLRIFIYNLGKFKKREGKQIVIKNIGL